MKQYAVLLTKLSSGDYVENLNSNRESFESNAGSLIDVTNSALFKEIPPEAGSIFTEALFLVGERMTKAKQAKALKKFVPIGDTIIGIVTKKLSDMLNGDLKTIMQSDSAKFFNTYTNIVLKKPERIDYSSVSQYAKAVDAFDNLEAFRIQCIESANTLAAAHKQLNRAIATKTKMTELIGETKAFGASVNKLYKLYKAIKIKAPSTENQ
ncbi:MAG: hypothetical protein EON99_00200 [Chitinophagaceae bacterium]|nr:MAG: hypothetical protein EON99_00200 [Chitinophagaceae bacterium]